MKAQWLLNQPVSQLVGAGGIALAALQLTNQLIGERRI
jgi:hypothetical protein